MTVERFRFAPDILARLGEELIPHPVQGIIELVRNAYDADSPTCVVELENVNTAGGTIRVIDAGVGMTPQDISEGWLILGRSRKATRRRTARFRRLTVGDKGLGRLAALRLGERALLRSRPKSDPGTEYRLTLDWADFDAAKLVEEVAVVVDSQATTEPPGTTIEIERLRVALDLTEVNRLARALVILADPFDDEQEFRPELRAPEFARLEQLVKRRYFDEVDFHLVARIDDTGRATAEVLDWKGAVLWRADHEVLRQYDIKAAQTQGTASSRSNKSTGRGRRGSRQDSARRTGAESSQENPALLRYSAPVAHFELWTFLRKQQSFHVRSVAVGDLRDWLDVVGGVHLYHRGLRVHPYGDPGHDWLDMNLMRVRSPEERPSTNNSIGRVVVLDPQEELLQKTDRSGFVENQAFEEIRTFARSALEWMADMRLKAREARKQRDKVSAPKQVRSAQASLAQTIKKLPPKVRPTVNRAVAQLDKAREKELRVVRDELELYRTLGTVGTTVAVFAHESAKPVTQIEQMAHVIERRGKRELDGRYPETLGKPVGFVLRAVTALKTYANLPLKLLARNKRKLGRVDVAAVVSDSVALFEPFLQEARIRVTVDQPDAGPFIRGTVSSLEAVLTNLLTNAIAALTGPNAPLNDRRVVVRTQRARNRVILQVLDNGPGIRGIKLEEIWLPGRTTRPEGTGLGLTIVRDAAADLGGRAKAVASGELGGAEFLIDLPSLDVAT